MNHRTLFIQFASAEAARAYAEEVRAMFERHLAWLKASGPKAWDGWRKKHPDGLTPPMHEFAKQAGFAWSKDDALLWDDDDFDPALTIATVGQLAIVSHGACLKIAADGLRSLAALRGATTSMFWNSDPVAMTLEVTLPTHEAERKLLDAAAGVDVVDDDDEVLISKRPKNQDARAVFTFGQQQHYLAFPRALEELLLALSDESVDVKLVVPAAPDRSLDVAAALRMCGQLYRSATRLRRTTPPTNFASALANRPVTEQELSLAVPETLSSERIGALREAADDFERTGWKLAACNPLTQDELVALKTADDDEKGTRQHLLRWSVVGWAFEKTGHPEVAVPQWAPLDLYPLDHRDLRGCDLTGRTFARNSFVESIVDGVDFGKSDLTDVTAVGLHAVKARFDGANLDGADLSRSILRDSSFRGASCKGTKFTDCDLTGCDFTDATVTDPAVNALVPAWVIHPKLGRGQLLEDTDGKVRVRFADGSERTLKREFVRFE